MFYLTPRSPNSFRPKHPKSTQTKYIHLLKGPGVTKVIALRVIDTACPTSFVITERIINELETGTDLSDRFEEGACAAEELIAERFSAAFLLCASLDIPGRLRRAEDIGSWLQLLHHDKKAIFTAGHKATEAAEYLRSFPREEASHA